MWLHPTNTSAIKSSTLVSNRKNDRSIFLAGFFQPGSIRDDFYSVYWLNKELSRIVYSTKEKALGMGKLDFWQESIENLYKV